MGDSSSRTAKHKRKRQRFYSQRAALHRHPPLHHHHHGWSTTLMSYGSGKYWRGETDRVLSIHFFYIKNFFFKNGGERKRKDRLRITACPPCNKSNASGTILGCECVSPPYLQPGTCSLPWLPRSLASSPGRGVALLSLALPELNCRRCVCWKMVDWSIRNRRGEVP